MLAVTLDQPASMVRMANILDISEALRDSKLFFFFLVKLE